MLSGHLSAVRSVAFSPDGTLLASGSEAPESVVRLWDVAQRREVAVLRKHTAEVSQVAFRPPDGKFLASVGKEGLVQVWDVAQRAPVASIEGLVGELDGPVFSPDGRLLVTMNGSGVYLWDVGSRAQVATLQGKNPVAFSPDGKLLATGREGDKTVGLWDVTRRAEVAILAGNTGAISSVDFSPDGRLLASGSRGSLGIPGDDWTVRLWDVAQRQEVAVLAGHTGDVWDVKFSPDGKWLASGSVDSTIRLWDVAQHTEVAVLRGHQGVVSSLAFSPDGKLLTSGSGAVFEPPVDPPYDKTVRLWDVEQRREVAVLEGHTGGVLAVAFHPGGKFLASGSGPPESVIRVWDVTRREEVAVLRGHHSWVSGVAFSPDGLLLASAAADGFTLLWGNPQPTAVEETERSTEGSLARPASYTLAQSIPNPFNPQTTIRYALPEPAEIRLVIYDLTGQRIRTLVQGVQQPGWYTVGWAGRDEEGREVASGIYLYRMEAMDRGFAETKRMLLVR